MEEFLTERTQDVEYGCLMAYCEEESWNEILDKIAKLPNVKWNYIDDSILCNKV
jgi:hypothetical protein